MELQNLETELPRTDAGDQLTEPGDSHGIRQNCIY